MDYTFMKFAWDLNKAILMHRAIQIQNISMSRKSEMHIKAVRINNICGLGADTLVCSDVSNDPAIAYSGIGTSVQVGNPNRL